MKKCDECGYTIRDGETEDPSHPHLMREVDDDCDDVFDLDGEVHPRRSTKPYSRDTIWYTNDGKAIAVRDLEDTHLANLIRFLHESPYHDEWKRKGEFINVLMDEVQARGLLPQFLDRAPIPYKDEQGNWRLWSFTEHKPVCLNTPEKTA